MKITRVGIENLNSLYGKHDLNLQEGLRDAPLFLIMGPTGSGKSTILDAICLALFGQTPRLSSGKTTKALEEQEAMANDSRRVMSLGTGHCLAEVEFSKLEDGAQARYRARWSCRRSRGKAQGKYQPVKRSLERYDEASAAYQTLVSGGKQADIRAAFDEVLNHMTVADFKRSVLLAQGEFSAFLKANEKERAAILERLTRTDIYERIGRVAAARHRASKEALSSAEAAQDHIVLLSDEEVSTLEAEHRTLEEALGLASQTLAAQQARMQWVTAWQVKTLALETAKRDAREVAIWAEQHAVGLARLEQHERCKVAEQTLASLERERGVVAQVAGVLPGQRQALELKSREVAGVSDQLAALDESRKVARVAYDRALPLIREAQQLRQALRGRQDEHSRAAKELEALRSEVALKQTHRKAHQQTTEALRAQERVVAASLAEVSHVVEIERALPRLEAEVARLKELEQRRAVQAEAVAGKGLAQLEGAAQQAAQAAERCQTEVARMRAGVVVAEQALAAAVGEAADEEAYRLALREEDRALERRGRHLVEVSRALAEHADAGALLASLRARESEASDTLSRHAAKRKELEGAQESLELALRQANARLAESQQASWLADVREQLEPGHACPLCGSEQHPHLEEGASPAAMPSAPREEGAALEAAVNDAQERVQAGREGLLGLHKAEGGASAQRKHLIAELGAAGVREAKLAEAFALLLKGLELPEDLCQRELSEQRELLEKLRKRVEARGQQVDRLSSSLRSAQAHLAASSRAEADAVSQQRRADATMHEERVLHQKLETQLKAIETELGRSTSAYQDDMTRLGVSQADGPQANAAALFGQALAQVQDLIGRRAGAEMVAERLRNKEQRLLILGEREKAVLKQCTEAEAMLADRQTAMVEASTEAARVLASVEDVDAHETALRRVSDEAVRAAELAGARRVEAFDALSRLKAEVSQLEQSHQQASTRLASLLETLNEALKTLSIASEAELRSLLLAPAEQVQLAELRERVVQRRREVATLVDDRQAALRAQLDSAQFEPPKDEEAVTHYKAEIAASQAEQARLNVDKGASSAKLAEHEAQSLRYRNASARLVSLRHDYQLWWRLHDLIGKDEGGRFKMFAQILNLRELLAKANHHLRDLAPRYSLVPATDREGQPVLSFAIVDGYQAATQRPIDTLSGGESFLVSLSLALALASYHDVQMPIDTLLIDEGFGTLDKETLDTAMNALEQLHAGRVQVGIISHVEGLKDRVEARIVVERQGNGRSSTRLELGGA